jgi:hypothetical protein
LLKLFLIGFSSTVEFISALFKVSLHFSIQPEPILLKELSISDFSTTFLSSIRLCVYLARSCCRRLGTHFSLVGSGVMWEGYRLFLQYLK